jgi:hypothetical protein
MVSQIHDTIVLQGAELDGRIKSVPFWTLGSRVAFMGKHGFAEKLQE